MQKRFESDPHVPGDHAVAPGANPQGDGVLCAHRRALRRTCDLRRPETPVRVFGSPNTPKPEVHLLSNGRYHVMITNAGGGYSRWKDIAVTRWREDSTCDNWGTFCYIRDVDERGVLVDGLSADAQTSGTLRSDLLGGDGRSSAAATTISTRIREIAVSPEDDIELRRITITNRSRTRRAIDVTSYAEVVLASAGRGRTASGVQQSLCSDRDHPRAAGDPLHAPAPLPGRAARHGCSI